MTPWSKREGGRGIEDIATGFQGEMAMRLKGAVAAARERYQNQRSSEFQLAKDIKGYPDGATPLTLEGARWIMGGGCSQAGGGLAGCGHSITRFDRWRMSAIGISRHLACGHIVSGLPTTPPKCGLGLSCMYVNSSARFLTLHTFQTSTVRAALGRGRRIKRHIILCAQLGSRTS